MHFVLARLVHSDHGKVLKVGPMIRQGLAQVWVLDHVRSADRGVIGLWTLRAHRNESLEAMLGPR